MNYYLSKKVNMSGKRINRSWAYFYVMKHDRPRDFKRLLRLGRGDPAVAYFKMRDIYFDLAERMNQLYYVAREHRKLSTIAKDAYSNTKLMKPRKTPYVQSLTKEIFNDKILGSPGVHLPSDLFRRIRLYKWVLAKYEGEFDELQY